MGADMVLVVMEVPATAPPDFRAGQAAVERLTVADARGGELWQRCAEDTDVDLQDDDEAVLATVKARLRQRITALRAAWEVGREYEVRTIGGRRVLITGGPTWGDAPTELFEVVCDLLDTPGVAEAMGCAGVGA